MRKVLRGHTKDRDDNLILIGTIPAPHSKDKPLPMERQDQRHLSARRNNPKKESSLVSACLYLAI